MEHLLRLWLALAGMGAYLCLRTVYRLYLHPLSHIPGPKLAACTHLYEFFYNVVRPGMFLFEIEKMHQQYGPIVRINPREVHVSDPAFYDEIYASSSRRRDKDVKFVATYALPVSMVATVDHDHHRFRRGILKDFFSRRAVMELSESVNERVQKLMQRLERSRIDQSIICLDDAFTALTTDVVTSYCCGKHWSFIEDDGFRVDLRKATADAIEFSHITRFVPWLVYAMSYLSPQVMSIILPGKAALFRFLESFLEYGKAGSQLDKRRSMVATLADPSLPPKERSYYRLRDETFAILAAGTETTSRVLTVASYYYAMDSTVRATLQAELKQLMPTPDSTPTWLELEQLPYLTAFIYESLRLAYGVTGRLPRVAPTETLRYGDYVIPPGTPMSSAAYIVHRDTTVFPDPDAFRPERWIEAAQKGENLKSLAHMELYLAVSQFARRFNVHLHNTEPEDMRIVRDMTVGYTRRGGLKVYAQLSPVDE
ncbi:benzoate 4-monooxygenase cytochrome p450 [Trichoderma arundinaceum]|uniref:Benzoate 4-monooxygenase cytochrome p450 n=1 Tax=Trichoderma arundinaceum TaxID=490622 RepID=A0A395NCT3_TRIAR|nr:benzoate 4-monooxygenase cytochrome p450 [Trichoderma arundinaceum]